MGPLLFSLAIQPVLSRLNSELVLGYLDDVTVGGEAGRVAQDIAMFRDESALLGLKLNISKCEVITYEGTHLPFPIDHFAAQSPDEAILLGAPLVEGPATDLLLSSRVADLSRAIDRLHLLSSHDALLILRHSLALLNSCTLFVHLHVQAMLSLIFLTLSFELLLVSSPTPDWMT